ncbi:META domain-containing protein [Oscillospiraceae bacterium N12]|jgi:heat shock protein HslJ|uniref:META domain-containing protein n=1 Tax=Jilunia laotingensis TaxID=2763675 RepID=A0A926IPG5_9BACT|nr:META domain-containing protein [Jilunia laotingensis]MBC8591658.1 META domain-containing protein [Jilunia laotingensis]
MKKVFVSVMLAGVALAMSSCRSSKEATSLSSMNGEWNIIEINGATVTPVQGQQVPFIGFDTTTGKLYGYSGCNRMMGSFDVNAKPGTIDLGAIGSTRMACPDMTMEQNVLSTLGQVKGYKKMGKGHMALCNASNRPVMVLAKKAADVTVKNLNGEWSIKEVHGETIPTGMEKQPFIAFDVKEKRIHGNAGCNLINGSYETVEGNELSISFPGVAATMMACPDMEIEGKILTALNEVKSFGKLAGGGIGLYNADGTLVLVLAKK